MIKEVPTVPDMPTGQLYSQLRTCPSAEVAAMIEGLLRTAPTPVPTRGSTPTTSTPWRERGRFAFTELLGFRLLPRLGAPPVRFR